MGLDFEGSKAHWSYSGFMRFRERLAKEIGINLRDMAGFNGLMPWSGVLDDIVPFLNHSDCDGNLSPDECRQVAPRLRELVAKWMPNDWDRITALALADDMERLAKEGKPLVFT